MRTHLRSMLPVAGLILLCVTVYSNSFHVPFQFDDDRLIRFNFSLRDLVHWKAIIHSELFRPLTMLSFGLNFQISQKDPFSYHVLNLLLHIITTLLFYALLMRLSSNKLFSWFAAALFAVHPLNTEAVTYISSRSILLCAVFYLLALLAFDFHLHQPHWTRGTFFFFCLLLAALSKEEAGSIPLAALLYNLVFFGAQSARRHRLLHLSSLFIVLVAFLFRLRTELIAFPGLPHSFSEYWSTELSVWLRYLGLAIFPVSLNIDHSVATLDLASGLFLLSAIGVAFLLTGLFWLLKRQQRLAGFWGVWFFLNLLPSSVIPLNDFMSEHRLYISMMGFCAVMSSLLLVVSKKTVKRPVLLIISLIALSVFYGGMTLMRNRIWSSKITLWYDAALKSPDKYRPHINLAFALFEVGETDIAIQEYLIARSLEPGIARTHVGLGFCYIKKGSLYDAVHSFRKALIIDPNFIDAKTGLGIVFYRQNQFGEALFFFEQVLPHRQESPELIAMMSISYLHLGQPEKALTLLEKKTDLDNRLGKSLSLLRNGSTETAMQILIALARL